MKSLARWTDSGRKKRVSGEGLEGHPAGPGQKVAIGHGRTKVDQTPKENRALNLG